MEMKEYLSRIRQRILKDGAENTLKMIREQKIGGPSASEIFGDIDYMGLTNPLERVMAAIEKICEYSGNYTGWEMYGFKRNHIQVEPQ